jgi:hypothetical protein
MRLEFSRQIFEENSNKSFIKIRPVGVELFHAHGQTDMTKLIVDFRSYANASNKLVDSENIWIQFHKTWNNLFSSSWDITF